MSLPSEASILRILDDGARAFVFPMLDNGYVYLAASRLAIFRSNDDWALTFEIFGYSPRSGLPDLSVTTFGSNLSETRTVADYVSEQAFEAYRVNYRHWRSEYFHPIEDETWLDEDDQESVAENASMLTLRGRSIPLPKDDDYAKAGMVGTPHEKRSVAELSRALAATHRDYVLATESERRVCVPPALSQLMLLDDWHHPDVVADELPSQTQTFRELASVMATGDAGLYLGGSGNTHWSNWPEGGTL